MKGSPAGAVSANGAATARAAANADAANTQHVRRHREEGLYTSVTSQYADASSSCATSACAATEQHGHAHQDGDDALDASSHRSAFIEGRWKFRRKCKWNDFFIFCCP